MSGVDEQIRCTKCGLTELYFGSYTDKYPYDVFVSGKKVSVLPVGRPRSHVINSISPITDYKLIREVVEDCYTTMTDNLSYYVWACPGCNEYFSSITELNKNLREVLRRFLE